MEFVTSMHLVARACGSTIQQWQHSQLINKNRRALYEAGVPCTAPSEGTGDAAHMPLRAVCPSPWCEQSNRRDGKRRRKAPARYPTSCCLAVTSLYIGTTCSGTTLAV